MSEPKQTRPKLELSPIKIAAGAAAAATAAAIGSTLGTAGTIVGAAVASAISASASAVIGHSLERGRDAAKKALPAALHDMRDAVGPRGGAVPSARDAVIAASLEAADVADVVAPPVDLTTELPATGLSPDISSSLDKTVILERGPHAETVVLPRIDVAAGAGAGAGAGAEQRPTNWIDRIPGGWKTLAGATAASFVIGIGAVSVVQLAQGNPPLQSNVWQPNGNSGSGNHTDQGPPAPDPGTHSTNPDTRPDTPTPTDTTSGGPTPTPTPTTVAPSTTPPTTTPTTGPSTTPDTPSTTPPTTGPTTVGPTTAPSTTAKAAASTPPGGKSGAPSGAA